MTIDSADEKCRMSEKHCASLLIFVAVLLHAAALMNARPLQSANDRSRWCTVWSLVERQTFQIDEIRQEPGWDSIDIIYDGGHFYSTKPPLLSVVVAAVTWSVQRVTGWKLLEQTQWVTGTVLLIVNIIPFALSLFVLSRLLKRVSSSAWTRLFVLASGAFGTLATPFLMTLNNHTVAIVGVMFSLYALELILSEESPAAGTFALCGLASGWACANELPAAALGVATFVLALRRSIRQTACWYVPAAIVPIAAFLATNYLATGSLKPTYASYGSAKYNFVIDGVPSYWMDPDGVDRNVDSPPIYFLHSMVGHHGIFSLTPVYVLVLGAWIFSGAIRNGPLRILVRLGALMTTLVVAFYMTRFENYNYGGVSCGLRWALWLIPFWLISLAPICDLASRSAPGRLSLLVLLGASMFSAWLPIENPWQQPWLFRRMEAWKWIDYTRRPPELPKKLWTWFSTLPDVGEAESSGHWIELTSSGVDGSIKRRRVIGRKIEGNPDLLDIEVQESIGDAPLKSAHRFRINAARFGEGATTADFVSWEAPETIPVAQKQADFTFVRALPLKREYRAGKIRYVHLPLRNDAFRCQMAAASVNYPQDDPSLLFRCDTWLSEELPFGVAQYEIKVTDLETGNIVQMEHWSVSDCFPPPAAQASFPVQ